MVRNVMKAVKDAKKIIDPKYDLYTGNVIDIRDASEDIYDMIHNGFCLGYLQGVKAVKASMNRGGAVVWMKYRFLTTRSLVKSEQLLLMGNCGL